MLAFFLGSLTASLLLVLAERLPRHMSLSGTSQCNHCAAPLQLRDVIPVLSWLALRGRSRCCHSRLPARYVLLEAAAGSWAGLWMLEVSPLRVAAAVAGVGAIFPVAYWRARRSLPA